MLITATSRVTTLGLALLFAIGMVSSGFASQGGLTTIDVPGASSTQAKGINPEGDIVGEYSNATGTHGFLLSKGNFTTIDVPGASITEAAAINFKGDIVGTYFASGRHGFLLSKGNFTTIDVPSASDTFANGITPEGDIVGTYFQSCFPCSTHGFLLSNGVF